MSQVRLYIDEDAMRRGLVFSLRARSIDVLTAAEAEMINRSDQDHLTVASESGRVLYTSTCRIIVSSTKPGFQKSDFKPGSSSRHNSATLPVKSFGGSCV